MNEKNIFLQFIFQIEILEKICKLYNAFKSQTRSKARIFFISAFFINDKMGLEDNYLHFNCVIKVLHIAGSCNTVLYFGKYIPLKVSSYYISLL